MVKTTGHSRWIGLAVAVLVSLAIPLSEASASHYRLDELGVFSEAQRDALSALGVETTEGYLERTLDSAMRSELSAQTGISELEVLVFARVCELLQIEGVGPRAAQLLRAAGVEGAMDLASRNAEELAAAAAAVNAVEALTGVNPTVENVQSWIDGAAQVRHHLQ